MDLGAALGDRAVRLALTADNATDWGASRDAPRFGILSAVARRMDRAMKQTLRPQGLIG